MWGVRLGDGGGQIGVMLFFLVSGFLMGRLYLEEKITTGSAFRFAQRRIARIVPLFLLVVLASFAIVSLSGASRGMPITVSGASHGMYPITVSNLADHLFFLSGVDVLWSIPVEVHFYMLFILIWVAASYVKIAVTGAVLAMAALLCVIIPHAGEEHELLYYLHFFLGGVVVAIAHSSGIIRQAKPWDIAFFVLAFAPLLLMPRITLELFGERLDLWKSPLVLIVLTLLLVSALGSSLADTVLGGRIGRFGGDISYSVYLVHDPILFWLGLVRPTSTKIFLLLFLTSVVLVSWTSYRLIERPSRRIINGIGQRTSVSVLHSA